MDRGGSCNIGPSASDVLQILVGIIAVVGAAVCTKGTFYRETGRRGGNSDKSHSGSKKK